MPRIRHGSKRRVATIAVMSAGALRTGDTDLAAVGALLAEPARAKVLLALADGRALAASVLAAEAGIAPSTASHHLGKLVDAGLITAVQRGRYKYFALASARVGELIEAVARVAPAQPISSLRQGTRAHALRYARRCYDHLAGRLGVALTDALRERQLLVAELARDANGAGARNQPEEAPAQAGYTVTEPGATLLAELGIEVQPGAVVRCCLDGSERRDHIAGPLGRALMTRLLELGWLAQDASTRAVRLTDSGRTNLPDRLGVRLP